MARGSRRRADATGLAVSHPALDIPLHVAGGEVRVLDDVVADAVVAAVLDPGAPGVQVTVGGSRLRGRSLAARVRRGLAVVSGAPVAADVTVLDHLVAVVGHGARDLLATSPLLADRGHDPAGVLSGGERRALGWLRARGVDPSAVLLDRAAEGLDAATVTWAGQVVADWATDGVAVVVRPGRAEERAWERNRTPDPATED